ERMTSPTSSRCTRSVLELDGDLPVTLLSDVAGGLYAALLDVVVVAGLDVGLQVLVVEAGRVRLGNSGDPVALEDHQDVVHGVLVDVPLLARRQVHLPDLGAVVLREQTGGDVPQHST